MLFIFAAISASAQTYGDANLDGKIDIVDALVIAQYYVGLNPARIDLVNSDVSGDGNVTIVDALLVAQYFVALITSFPVENQTVTPVVTPVPVPTGVPTATPAAGPTTIPTAAPTSAATPAATALATTTPSSSTPGVTMPPNTTEVPGTPMPAITPDPDETGSFFFSYDDSASTASVELVKYAINNGTKPDPGLARPWEFLNFETFAPVSKTDIGLFNVSMGLWERPSLKEGYAKEYKLGVYVESPTINADTCKNVVLTLLVDVSGSMSTQCLRVDAQTVTRMDLVKYGLNFLPNSLKDGDIINIATFETTASIAYQGLRYPADLATYNNAVSALAPLGTTNLADGIAKAYQAALATYDPEKTNRVIILTDAYANTGEIDPSVIAQNVIINDKEGIYFSGLGISEDFNEVFLNELTDAGKGAYFSIVTRNDASRAFRDRFISLLAIAAKDVEFRMDYPAILEHDVTAAEETSGEPGQVQTTNFSFNTKQYFFEGFLLKSGELPSSVFFRLSANYTNPATGAAVVETCEKSLNELLGVDLPLIKDAETIYLFTQLIGLQKTWGEISPVFSTFYGGYSSPIYTEYMGLVKKYLGEKVEVIPSPVSFGSVPVGTTVQKMVTISNTTLNPINVYEVTLSNQSSPFRLTATTPVSIKPMEVLNMKLSFSPDVTASFTNTILIDWDYGTSDYTLSMTGVGVTAPTPTAAP